MSDTDRPLVPEAGAPQPTAGAPAVPLPEWVRQHELTWELGPRYAMVSRQKRQIGWDLRLHAEAPSGVDPGTPRTDVLHERLRQIAAEAIPEGLSHQVEPFDSAFHLRPENEFEPEVELLAIIFRSDPESDVSEEEMAPLREVGRRLSALGAREKVWRR